MINVTVQVSTGEVLLRLDQLPRRVRRALTDKMNDIIRLAKTDMLSGPPGKFIDSTYVKSGVETIGSLLIGFIEVEDKPGVYQIYPSKARILKFIAKSGDLVKTRRVLRHPFPKGAPVVERYLTENKPWIIDQVEDAVIEAL